MSHADLKIFKTDYFQCKAEGLVEIELPRDSQILMAYPESIHEKGTRNAIDLVSVLYICKASVESTKERRVLFFVTKDRAEFTHKIIRELPPVWWGGDIFGMSVKCFVFEVET